MPAAARGRPKGYRVPDEVKVRIGQGVAAARQHMSPQTQEYYRGKIKTLAILNALGRIASGTVEGKPNQVAAATVLLRKVLPDLATVEHTSKDGITTLTIITGVVRAEDLERAKVIEHQASPSLPPSIDDKSSD